MQDLFKSFLPDRESNPGLPRDRRRSSPLDYRGLVIAREKDCLKIPSLQHPNLCISNAQFGHAPLVSGHMPACLILCMKWAVKKSYSFEPDLNQRPMDYCY